MITTGIKGNLPWIGLWLRVPDCRSGRGFVYNQTGVLMFFLFIN